MRQIFDRRSVLGLAVGSAAGAMFVSSAKPTYAAATSYKASLDGKSEVPPTTSSGTGTATVTYDPSTKMVTWQGNFSGLSGPATAAHIHGPAEAGKNAGVIVPLSQKDVPFTSPFTGSATLADDKAAALEAALSGGLAYVNIHTAANPGGEVRGQLAKG
jgi:CHRD domain